MRTNRIAIFVGLLCFTAWISISLQLFCSFAAIAEAQAVQLKIGEVEVILDDAKVPADRSELIRDLNGLETVRQLALEKLRQWDLYEAGSPALMRIVLDDFRLRDGATRAILGPLSGWDRIGAEVEILDGRTPLLSTRVEGSGGNGNPFYISRNARGTSLFRYTGAEAAKFVLKNKEQQLASTRAMPSPSEHTARSRYPFREGFHDNVVEEGRAPVPSKSGRATLEGPVGAPEGITARLEPPHREISGARRVTPYAVPSKNAPSTKTISSRQRAAAGAASSRAVTPGKTAKKASAPSAAKTKQAPKKPVAESSSDAESATISKNVGLQGECTLEQVLSMKQVHMSDEDVRAACQKRR